MRYLRIIAVCFLIGTLIDMLAVAALQRFNMIMTANTDMKNLPYGLAVGFNLMLAVATFPIFLNLKTWIRSRVVVSAISFFLLPLGVMILLSLSLEEEVLTGLLFCLPYLVVLLIGFIRFRERLGSG